ncbi:hypothetical protein AB0D11_35245 [Streptomyces monashensis]|uniref:hypothetical protein n=1 Tax=Streptomyces monashensis TaxID=1678012 RepID=UPI0033E5CA58
MTSGAAQPGNGLLDLRIIGHPGRVVPYGSPQPLLQQYGAEVVPLARVPQPRTLDVLPAHRLQVLQERPFGLILLGRRPDPSGSRAPRLPMSR